MERPETESRTPARSRKTTEAAQSAQSAQSAQIRAGDRVRILWPAVCAGQMGTVLQFTDVRSAPSIATVQLNAGGKFLCGRDLLERIDTDS